MNRIRTRLLPLLAVMLVVICACQRGTMDPSKRPVLQGEALGRELDRCRHLGLEVYRDRACVAAWKANDDHFLGRDKGLRR
ncbi:putative entry exclusion protein TrbK-alt [Phenylobacterium sp.]|uniref:putative entry exclusion protein TrbK-alt n=1 Tax=Phenylobacterium sp. TaxID=1871053 RepID=UPI003BAD49C9